MPLMKSKSQKAFSHNVKTEMEHGKPQNVALGIAYSVKRKAKKASGGTVESGSPDMNMADGGEVDAKRKERETRGTHLFPESHITGVHHPKMGRDKTTSKAAAEAALAQQRRIKPGLKGLAEGGAISAHDEARPSTQTEENDRHEIARQHAAKALDPKQDATSPKNRTAARGGLKTTPIKHPKMVPSNALSTKLYDKEGNLIDTASPESPNRSFPADEHEEGADRHGPSPKKAMAHSTHKMMAEGGDVDERSETHPMDIEHHDEPLPGQETDTTRAMKRVRQTVEPIVEKIQKRNPPPSKPQYAKGGQVDQYDYDHSDPNAMTDSDMHLHPSEDEGTMYADSHDEEGQDRQGPAESSTQAKTGRKPTHGLTMMASGGDVDSAMEVIPDRGFGKIIRVGLADGGELNPAHGHFSPDDSEMQPEEEAHDEHENSIAAAIMAKKRMASGGTVRSGSPTMDYADGGEVDLSRNADEDPNNEDQMSFEALKKENYSESEGLRELGDQPHDSNLKSDSEEMDSHDRYDMVDAIRKKMKSKRQMPLE